MPEDLYVFGSVRFVVTEAGAYSRHSRGAYARSRTHEEISYRCRVYPLRSEAVAREGRMAVRSKGVCQAFPLGVPQQIVGFGLGILLNGQARLGRHSSFFY